MKSTIVKEENGNIILTITIPKDLVKTSRTTVVDTMAKKANLPGFRKGKAPKKMVEDNLNPQQIQEEVLKSLLPQAYMEAVNEHKIRPIMNPKIHVDKLEIGEDWQFTATTCEMPKVTLGKYKEAVQKITAKNKIIVPGKEPEKPDFNKIMEAVLSEVTAEIPLILVGQEVDKLLSQMLDEVKRLGLTLDQYLSSTGKTPETLRKEYETKAMADTQLEFALAKIAETEKITVEEKEVDEAIFKAKSPEEKKHLEDNRYLLTSILRQQKTLDFIRNL